MKIPVCIFRGLSVRSVGAAETEGGADGPRTEKHLRERRREKAARESCGTSCGGQELFQASGEGGRGKAGCAGGGKKVTPPEPEAGHSAPETVRFRDSGPEERFGTPGRRGRTEDVRLPKSSGHSAALVGPAERYMAVRIGSMLEGASAGTVVEQLVRMGIVDCRRLRILCIRDFVHAAADGGMRRTAAMRLAARRFGASESFVSKCMYRYRDINL